MTNNPEITVTLNQAIRKSAVGLAIFAFFTAGIISVTQYLTKDLIRDNERDYEARLLLSLLPNGYEADHILDSAQSFESIDAQQLGLLNISGSELYYQALTATGDIAVVILPTIAPEGYTEAIRLIVGISPGGEIIGARVTRHKETPGLGDQIELQKSDWILNFNGASLTNPAQEQWNVKKDGGNFDQMTGATITPRAVVKAIKQTLMFFELNKDRLLAKRDTTEEVTE